MNFLAKTDGKDIEYNSMTRLNDFLAFIGECKIRIKIDKIGRRRTLTQNRAMHLYWTLVSKEFQKAGLDARVVFKKEVDIPVSPEMVKDLMWRPIQIALLKKKRTRDLKSNEVTQVFEVINRHLGERFKFHVPFPSRDWIEGYDY